MANFFSVCVVHGVTENITNLTEHACLTSEKEVHEYLGNRTILVDAFTHLHDLNVHRVVTKCISCNGVVNACTRIWVFWYV